jgi:dienelactone hydrolase
MPDFRPSTDFSIDQGHIVIVGKTQRYFAYWAHPRVGGRYSGIALLHDWWGMANWVRLMANFFAMHGYYVIAPDLFDGTKAKTPREAMQLLVQTEDTRYQGLDAALTVLETHSHTNRKVAAVGIGMGGTLAFEAALTRTDLEAAVAFGGFPQAFIGRFSGCTTPILALYGAQEPFVRPIVQNKLREELSASPTAGKSGVETVEGVAHDFFKDDMTDDEFSRARSVYLRALAFLRDFLPLPQRSQII